jgi:Flp pilus assembly protein CpaB
MNTILNAIVILTSVGLIAGIGIDVWLHRPKKVNKMSYDQRINDVLFASGENEGERLSQEEILKNASYLSNNYVDILSK